MSDFGKWSVEDAMKGLCQIEDIGEDRPIEIPPAATGLNANSNLNTLQVLSKDERINLMQQLSDAILQIAVRNPEGFLMNNGAQINKFIEISSKLDAKDDSKTLDPMNFTQGEMEKMNLSDFLLMTLNSSMDEGLFSSEDARSAFVKDLRQQYADTNRGDRCQYCGVRTMLIKDPLTGEVVTNPKLMNDWLAAAKGNSAV